MHAHTHTHAHKYACVCVRVQKEIRVKKFLSEVFGCLSNIMSEVLSF